MSSSVHNPAPAPPAAAHFFTVDVEEHFQVGAFEGIVSRDAWDAHPTRVERNVDRLLEMLAAAGATGTFFTLGWVAARHPAMVRRIADAGHAVASHGATHRRVNQLSPASFREEIRSSKAVLEEASGQAVVGFRAPNFSILPGCEWAFDILVEEGYRYDSSRFPIRRPGYGSPATPRQAHHVACRGGTLLEVPLTTLRVLGARVPAAGGAYLRHFPYEVVRTAFRDCERRQEPGVFYIHPWEVDPEQPRITAPLLTRARHYGGLARTAPRITRLLQEFTFTSIEQRLDALVASSANVVA